MKKLLPFILLITGIGGGVGAGLALRPAPAPLDAAHADGASKGPQDTEKKEKKASGHDAPGAGGLDYVKLNNQFVVPVLYRDAVQSLVVMSLSIELKSGSAEAVYLREPKLRDQFLQVLFDHANMGGFQGEFTSPKKLDVLRGALLDVARHVVGPEVSGVLITDIARQDT